MLLIFFKSKLIFKDIEPHLKVKSSHVKKRYINEKIIKRANQLTGDI